MAGGHVSSSVLSLSHLTVIDADPLTLLAAAEAGGFNAIGLRIVPPRIADPVFPIVGNEDLLRAIEKRCAATGMQIFDIEAFWLAPDTDVAVFEAAIATGRRLGAKYLLAIGNDPDMVRLAENFCRLCDLAARYQMRVSLEPMPFVTIRTIPEAVAFLRPLGNANAGLVVDSLHFFRAGTTLDVLRGLDRALLDYVQLCDAGGTVPPDLVALRAEARGNRFYPGEGKLPLREFVAALPHDVPMSVEAPCVAYADLGPEARARLCGDATRAVLAGSPFAARSSA